MKKLLFLLVAVAVTLNACRKEKCTNCNCETTITQFDGLMPVTDSASAIASVKGNWQLTCSQFTSKYGNVSYTDHTGGESIKVNFTDTTYTFYQKDSLLFTYPYFADSAGYLRSNGNSFYQGVLGSSSVKVQNNQFGINTVYPFTGSYYLVFKRL